MKEELIRALNNKLSDLNSDIDSLTEIDNKISIENDNLSYVSGILDLFNDGTEDNILNFAKINKEDFNKVLDIIGSNAKDVFNTDSCNYDGLVYLINGINSGISLELNEEQKNGISFLISELSNKVDEYSSAIDGYELVKTRYEISDISELEKKKDNYNKTIDNLESNNYISDTDLLMEALYYNDMPEEKIIDVLGFVLEYNANVYKERGPVVVKEKVTKPVDLPHEEEKVEESIDLPHEEEKVEEKKEEVHDEIKFDHDEYVPFVNEEIKFDDKDNQDELANNMFSLEENDNHIEKEESENSEESAMDEEFHFNDINDSTIQEFNPVSFDTPLVTEEEHEEKKEEEIPFEPVVEEVVKDEVTEEPVESVEVENNEEIVVGPVDNDFKDIIDSSVDYDNKEEEPAGEMTSTRELQKLFDKYGIKESNSHLNELVTGDINKYQDMLETFKKKGLDSKITGDLLVEILLNSTADDVIKILDIIEEDLSVDKDDYDITLKIAIDTIPSAFIVDGGNYHNFIDNTVLFKELGINLINLFDFSKEIFVANHERILKNLDIVQKYGFEINYRNAKYLLLLPDIGDRLDYYIESVYEDKLKGETFDGIEYIKEYAPKLNVVTDETIKRIRYSSENGRKVFGSKPKSLTGEITNLKVNALDISSDYLNKFFDNEFSNLTGDEVREYTKLIHNSSNVGNYSDELEVLNQYQNGLRYVIEGINISSNKVIRNYNILRSYGMDKKKSLEFAVCYNLVITKEEYDRLESKLDEIGGNL